MKRRLRSLPSIAAGMAVLAIVFAGCQEEPTRRHEAAPPVVEEAPDVTPVQPADPPDAAAVAARADRLVARLMQAVNEGDAATIAALSAIPPERPDLDAGRAALADYRRYFGGADVAQYRQIDSEEAGVDARLVYLLEAPSGARKALLVYYEAQYDTLRAFDEFLYYSARAHAYASAIVAAVRAADADELASLLSVDDLDYPVPLARMAIENYAERFDLATIEVVFAGLAPQSSQPYLRPFLFSVRGTRNGQLQSNQVRMIAGDGLLGWRDPLVPEIPSS